MLVKLATYNIRQGGKKRVHWSTMIDRHGVDLLLVQESHPHDEHLPPLLYPNSRGKSVWSMASPNAWGSAIFSKTGTLQPIAVESFDGWVVGAELTGASWQPDGESTLVFSVHAPGGLGGYAGRVNAILDAIEQIAGGSEVIIGGDFNLSVSNWSGSAMAVSKKDLAIQARLADRLGLINCWQEANPNQEPGQTLRWTREPTTPYHCDGIFVPKSWRSRLKSCSILSGDEWNRLSDHNPVVAELSEAT